MYSPYILLALSLLTAFNVFGAQNNNHPSPDLTTSTSIKVPYRSSFSSYKPYVEEEVSSWRALNKQVTRESPTDHSMGNMKGMDHNKMKSMPSGHTMPEMNGVQHDHVEPSPSEIPMAPMKGMDHESMKEIPAPTTQPSVKEVHRDPQQEILMAMNNEEMPSKHASIPARENVSHEHNETETSSSFMTPMAAMDHRSTKDMPNKTGKPSSREPPEQTYQHQDEHAASGGAGGGMPLKINAAGPVIQFQLIPNAHPIAVHFPIALTLIALLFSLAARIGSRHNLATQLSTVGHWALWISGVTAIFAAGLGWLAFNSVDHDDAGHAAMLIHRNWAVPTALGLLLLAMWDVFKSRAHHAMSWFTLIVLALLCGSVAVTGWLGGEVVYRHGIGVLSLPEIAAGNDSHGHEHGDSDSHSHQYGASTINEKSKPAHQH